MVGLFVVSKIKFVVVVCEVYVVGFCDFGENYLQEVFGKQVELVDLFLNWYFIGFIQLNKMWFIVEYFQWVYLVDWLKIVQCLLE